MTRAKLCGSAQVRRYVILSQWRGISLRLAEAFVWLCDEIPRCAQDDMELSAESAGYVILSQWRDFVALGRSVRVAVQ